MKACNQCGKCCIQYSNGGLVATSSEIETWKRDYPQIAGYVHAGKIWFDPKTKLQLTRCPWLKEVPPSKFSNRTKYSCSIYLQRPDDCRHYPVTIDEMIRDGCEMIETRDLLRPKQAQRQLDKLMEDSRPGLE